MNEFYTVLSAVLPVFLITGAGVLMRKWNWLTEEADHSLLRVTINLLTPCLIFDSILQNEAVKQIGNVLLAPVVGFFAVGLGMAVALAFGRLSDLKELKQVRTFALCVGLFNYGYVPVPLAKTLFDKETLGVLFVHNVGVEAAMWTLGLMVLGGVNAGRDWRKVFNPPVIAIFVALTINFLFGDAIKAALQTDGSIAGKSLQGALLTIRMLGQCAIPMGLILIGATMADHLHEFHSEAGWRVMISSCLLRLGLLPMLFILTAKYLPCSTELKRVIILQAAMPAAVFPIVMARHYGGDTSTALRVVIGTSAVGLITIPLWIRFGIHFAGL